MGVEDGEWMLEGGCVCVRESESFQFSRVVSRTVKMYSGKDTIEMCRTESKEESYSTLAYAKCTHVILRYMIRNRLILAFWLHLSFARSGQSIAVR